MDKTVFVVDDSITNLSLAEEALEDDFRVLTFSSAAKMFVVLEKVRPDVILLDIEMPEMNGFEAMKQLRASETYSKIPVIFLTALDDAAGEAGSTETGAAGFIRKPFSPSDLLDHIKRVLD